MMMAMMIMVKKKKIWILVNSSQFHSVSGPLVETEKASKFSVSIPIYTGQNPGFRPICLQLPKWLWALVFRLKKKNSNLHKKSRDII